MYDTYRKRHDCTYYSMALWSQCVECHGHCVAGSALQPETDVVIKGLHMNSSLTTEANHGVCYPYHQSEVHTHCCFNTTQDARNYVYMYMYVQAIHICT